MGGDHHDIPVEIERNLSGNPNVHQKQQQKENPVFDMTSFEDMLDDVLTEPVPDTAMVKPSGSKHKKGKK